MPPALALSSFLLVVGPQELAELNFPREARDPSFFFLSDNKSKEIPGKKKRILLINRLASFFFFVKNEETTHPNDIEVEVERKVFYSFRILWIFGIASISL